jgi:pimeloyl-ACP methyl ester carboxylesterase
MCFSLADIVLRFPFLNFSPRSGCHPFSVFSCSTLKASWYVSVLLPCRAIAAALLVEHRQRRTDNHKVLDFSPSSSSSIIVFHPTISRVESRKDQHLEARGIQQQKSFNMHISRTPSAVLIIHGGYFLPTAWEPFVKDLRAAGFVVACPRLPTCGDSRPPKALLADDVAVVQAEARTLSEKGHIFAILAHSYGGIVATEAIGSDLYAGERGGGVSHLIFLSAWLVQPGDSLGDVIGKYGFQSQVDLGQNEDGTVWAKNAPHSFYHDVDSDRAESLATGNVTHNWAAVLDKVKAAPWKDLDTIYIHCLQDRAIELPLQESMVAAANAARSSPMVVKSIDSSHCPFLSRPRELIAIIQEIIWS